MRVGRRECAVGGARPRTLGYQQDSRALQLVLKGFECGSHFRVRVNSCESVANLREIIDEFFFTPPAGAARDVGISLESV